MVYLQLLKKFGPYILIALLCFSTYTLNKQRVKLKNDNNRHTMNIKNMHFEIDSVRTKNGELKYEVNSLTIKANEMEHFNKTVYDKLLEMDLKIKNLKSVTNVSYNYTYDVDTLKTEKNDNGIYEFNHDKDNLLVSGGIVIPENFPETNPTISDLQVEVSDTLIVVPEILWKRRWIFWKRATGVKTHIKSENKAFKLDQVHTYEFIK